VTAPVYGPRVPRPRQTEAFEPYVHERIHGYPEIGITIPDRPKSDGHPPWAHDEIEAFRKRWKIGTTKRLAFELLF